MYPDIQHIISLSKEAAKRILEIYREPDFAIHFKQDKSPLTQADSESHHIICEGLARYYPDIPVISEESTSPQAQNSDTFFLVDPLDGTKEFINRNDEFTINIALIQKGEPVLGVINAPALDMIYYAERGKGAFKISKNTITRLLPKKNNSETITVAVSRSHSCLQTESFLEDLKKQGKKIETISAGSALKFGLIAEGQADIYPRFTPTMEWDTAAGQVVVEEAGKRVFSIDSGNPVKYNKKELKNTGFMAR